LDSSPDNPNGSNNGNNVSVRSDITVIITKKSAKLNPIMNETFYLNLEGERVFPTSMEVETQRGENNPYEFTVLAGHHTHTQETGDDYAIAFIDGSTPPQIVNRHQPLEDYPITSEPDDYLTCVSWRPEENTLRIYRFTSDRAQLTVSTAGRTSSRDISQRHVEHQSGDFIIWMGKGTLYDICRQKPFQTGDLTDLNPAKDSLPAPFIQAAKSHLPVHSYLLTQL
jgi:hypothetical protein